MKACICRRLRDGLSTGAEGSFPLKSNTATVTISVSASGGGSSLILAPSDDATVKQAFATSVFNDASLIVRKSSNSVHSYLKFTVTGLAGAPSAAKLRLFVTDPSPNAGPIYTASNTAPSGTAWSESTVTWNTKPAIGTTVLSSLGAVSTGSWVEYDLKNSISGNGTYSFALTGGSSDHAWFSSSEGANLPQLVVTPGRERMELAGLEPATSWVRFRRNAS